MQLCSNSFSRQPFAVILTLDQARQHVAIGIAGFGPPALDQIFQVGEKILHRLVAAGKRSPPRSPAPARPESPATSRAGARARSRGTSSRLPMTSTGIAEAKSSISSTASFRGDCIEQPVDQRDQIGLHLRDRARRQRAHDQPSHPGVRGRVVEDEAGGVVLVERRIAVFRRKLLLLVGTEDLRVLVGGDQIVIAGQEVGTVGQSLDRLMLPQCPINRVGVCINSGVSFSMSKLAASSRACAFMLPSPWAKPLCRFCSLPKPGRRQLHRDAHPRRVRDLGRSNVQLNGCTAANFLTFYEVSAYSQT